MAASIQKAVTAISKQFSFALFQKPLHCHKASTQLDFQRFRRRRRHPQPWVFSKKDPGLGYQSLEVSSENKAFLRELVEDKYTDSPLKEAPVIRKEWTRKTFRSGVIALKLGSYPLFYKSGKRCTCICYQVVDNHVLHYIPPETMADELNYRKKWKLKYGGLKVGAFSCDPYQFTEHYNQQFEEAGVPPKRKVVKFIVSPDATLEAGTPLTANHFKLGQYVDVQAKTIGHGFQGVVKRWGMKGGPASHGASRFHRRPGGIGFGKKYVMKGKKMPGRMGFKWTRQLGLRVLRINTKYNVIYVHGSRTPGPNHCYTKIFDTRLKNRRQEMLEDPPYMPTFIPEIDAPDGLPEDMIHESLHDFGAESITYEVEKKKSKA